MKILALTDIHGAYEKALKIIGSEAPDVVVIGGDLTTMGSVREAEEALGNYVRQVGHLFCIAGNMDLPTHDDLFVRMGISVNGRGAMVDDVGFFGVSAAPHSPLRTPYEISEEAISERVHAGYAQVRHARVKIFIPHAPPYGTRVDIVHAGYHVGSTAVREFIELEQPQLILCGHIHEGRGEDRIEQSLIVNCGAASAGNYVIVSITDTIVVSLRTWHPRATVP